MLSELNPRLAFMLKRRSSRTYRVMIFTGFCITESQDEQQIVTSVDERLQLLPLNQGSHGSSPKSGLTQPAAVTATPVFAEFQINRFTDLGRSVGTEAQAKTEQVSVTVPARDWDFSSRKSKQGLQSMEHVHSRK